MDQPTVQLERCERCDSPTDALDLTTDPRWGEVCDQCDATLRNQHGEVSDE